MLMKIVCWPQKTSQIAVSKETMDDMSKEEMTIILELCFYHICLFAIEVGSDGDRHSIHSTTGGISHQQDCCSTLYCIFWSAQISNSASINFYIGPVDNLLVLAIWQHIVNAIEPGFIVECGFRIPLQPGLEPGFKSRMLWCEHKIPN